MRVVHAAALTVGRAAAGLGRVRPGSRRCRGPGEGEEEGRAGQAGQGLHRRRHRPVDGARVDDAGPSGDGEPAAAEGQPRRGPARGEGQPAAEGQAPPRAGARRGGRPDATAAEDPPKAEAEARAKAAADWRKRLDQARKEEAVYKDIIDKLQLELNDTSGGFYNPGRAAKHRLPGREQAEARRGPGAASRRSRTRAAATAIAEPRRTRATRSIRASSPRSSLSVDAPRRLARFDRPASRPRSRARTVRASLPARRRRRRPAAAAGPGSRCGRTSTVVRKPPAAASPSVRTTATRRQARPVDPRARSRAAGRARSPPRAPRGGPRCPPSRSGSARGRRARPRRRPRRPPGLAACGAPRRPCRTRPRGRRAASCSRWPEALAEVDGAGGVVTNRPAGHPVHHRCGRPARRAARAARAPPSTAPRPRRASARGSWPGPCPGPTTGGPPRAPGRSRAGR